MKIKRISILLVVSVFTIIFFQYCYLKCQETGEGALMVLEEEAFSFGEVEEGVVLTHVFNFQNCGTDTLRIRRVRGT